MSATETAALSLPEDLVDDELDALPGEPDVEIAEPVAPSKPAKPRARTSRVVVRRVDPWTVLKLSLLFYLCVCLVLLVAGCLLWAGAAAAGVIGNVEGFISDIGFDDFRFVPADILRASMIGGLVLVVAGTLANTLMAVLFNLMSDVVGGVKVTLAEDLHRPRKHD